MDFQELKNRVSIVEMAEKLGYRLNASAGKRYLEYQLFNGSTKIDEIVIYPNNLHQTYFSRSGVGDKGDLISFVKNRLNMFSAYSGTGYAAVADILSRHLGVATQNYVVLPKTEAVSHFNLADYDVNHNAKIIFAYLSKVRGIAASTISDFLKIGAVCTVARNDMQYKKYNVAFPFKEIGKDEVVNYELRNFNNYTNQGYKGFCSGGNKSSACWCAVFAAKSDQVKNVYIGESALDMMALYEMMDPKDRKNSAFISVGGNLVYAQIRGLRTAFPNSRINLAFDKDVQGCIYDIEAAHFFVRSEEPKVYKKDGTIVVDLNGKKETFSIDNFNVNTYLSDKGLLDNSISVIKADGAKDFNDMLLSKKKVENELCK